MKYIVLIFMVSWVANSMAMDWESPIDIKYKNKNANLFIQYVEAREMVSSYSGNTNDLKQAFTVLIEILKVDSEFAPAYRELGRVIVSAGHINYKNFKG